MPGVGRGLELASRSFAGRREVKGPPRPFSNWRRLVLRPSTTRSTSNTICFKEVDSCGVSSVSDRFTCPPARALEEEWQRRWSPLP